MTLLHPELLRGKRAAVTGSAHGIGAQIAAELAAGGAEVFALDIADPIETVTAITSNGGAASGAVVDVRDRDALARVFGALDHLEILVTSAGVYGDPIALEDITADEFDRVLDINLKGSLWSIAAALPLLRVKGGNIVSIGSAAGKVGGVASGPQYVASKGALHATIKWVARTEAANGIVVNAVAPGAIDTDMIAGRGYDGSYCPLGRLGRASEVAQVAAFLASPGASYMTGAVVDVNGGFVMA